MWSRKNIENRKHKNKIKSQRSLSEAWEEIRKHTLNILCRTRFD